MIFYKGCIMESDIHFIDAARDLDEEFADALKEYLPIVSALIEENDDLYATIDELKNGDAQLRIKKQADTILELDKENERFRSQLKGLEFKYEDMQNELIKMRLESERCKKQKDDSLDLIDVLPFK